MKPALAPALLLAACLLPSAAGAAGGTLQFVGALVEPTCEARVMDAQPQPGHLSVRLWSCLLPSSFVTAGPHDHAAQVTGLLQVMDLSAPVAAVAGRHRVQMMTVEYH